MSVLSEFGTEPGGQGAPQTTGPSRTPDLEPGKTGITHDSEQKPGPSFDRL